MVITGIGIVSPIGLGETDFCTSLREGRSGAGAVTMFDTTELPRRIACEVRSPLPDTGLPESTGRAARLAAVATRQAIDSAEFKKELQVKPSRLSVLMGTTMGETEFIERRLGMPDEQWLAPDHAAEILSGRPGSIACHVARSLPIVAASGRPPLSADLYGACAAGNMAIGAVRRQLLSGECDIGLAGGADGFSQLAFIGFMRLRVMAAEVCKPFDETRDGLLVGEGAAVFVMERESDAKARGARIRARILGAADTCENYHPTRPHPEGDGLSRAITQALKDADLSAADIDYVCAHGTGTPQNDAIELRVMNRLFVEGTPFSSVKALTGHTMGAASAIELAACVLSIEHQTLIPTWHLDKVLQPCSLDAVSNSARAARIRCTINNAAGFGGYNSSVIVAKV